MSGEILEIGNVLSYYFSFPHTVVDKYEKSPGVLNEDVVDYVPGRTFDAIVTISTLEHVGWDEQPREPGKVRRAIEKLKGFVSPGGKLLATVPLGYNPEVDELVRSGTTGFDEVKFLVRVSARNEWREALLEEVASAKFGAPYSCANALAVGIFQNRQT